MAAPAKVIAKANNLKRRQTRETEARISAISALICLGRIPHSCAQHNRLAEQDARTHEEPLSECM
jgi:hypothetical protein